MILSSLTLSSTIPDLMSVESLVSLLTLTAMEIVLGIDNIVFISILTGKLPEEQRAKARRLGLAVAMGSRIVLLISIAWIMKLKAVLFTIPAIWPLENGVDMTGKGLILLIGGAFLIVKATKEIHHKIDSQESASGNNPDPSRRLGTPRYGSVILQIMLIDIVFSLDSVITAVGMAKHIEIMIAAVVIAVGVMMGAVGTISRFVEKNPTIKMLALSFLLLIGVMLMGDALGAHLPKGYVYFAMAFSLGVEMLNLRVKKGAAR